jgi:acyl-CoA thioesterase FadM
VYDLELISEDGTVQEKWEGLRLKKIEAIPAEGPWAVPLLGPYVERRLQELIPDAEVTVALQRDGERPRDARSDSGIRQALGRPVAVHRRPDGKPEVSSGQKVSAAHASDLTMAVYASGPVGCDLEPVTSRSATTWRDLLGAERMQFAEWIAQEQGEDTNWAATRVWSVLECIKKAGFATESPLVWVSGHTDGWVVVKAGSLAAATCLTRVRGLAAPLVVGVVVTPPTEAPPPVNGYRYTHIVGFEETNLLGNVYYTNYLLWQGRCRETFLREKAPEILEQIKDGLHLATTHCSCEYLSELKALDEIDVQMYIEKIHEERIDLGFEYWRTTAGQKQLVARGRQQIACILSDGSRAIPEILRAALEPYAVTPS